MYASCSKPSATTERGAGSGDLRQRGREFGMEPNPAKRLRTPEEEGGEVRENGGGEQPERRKTADVSIIMPVHNASCWLEECLQAIMHQDFTGSMELSVFDDASTDDSRKVLEGWRERMEDRGISVVISGHGSSQPGGVGFAKNKAVTQSSGRYLCFQDADDIMLPQRVRLQYETSILHPNSLIGCRVQRLPEGSTERYARWINSLTQDQLLTQAYTSHGPTVVMPTWFCSRKLFMKVGLFDEGGKTIWKLRVDFLQERVLSQWESFTIWNAGKQGRKLYRSLSLISQKKVKAFCDVDENKIQKRFYTHEESKERPKPTVPVLHYKEATGPFIICVKLPNDIMIQGVCRAQDVEPTQNEASRRFASIPRSPFDPSSVVCVGLSFMFACGCVSQDMTGGVLEENLRSLQLKEGTDYYHFN
ncbi:hypothetical protein CCH79_00014301 [Gambusia affinis]|uniref:Glycosyltransferase 2-like domain-containing protein n=1 Tax=Gambusia affinis TaxID=33528 RepID=A0A315UTF8_GAMAF|nr:hypothetical protein CCH79_00014301 [Gambusia affinis]